MHMSTHLDIRPDTVVLSHFAELEFHLITFQAPLYDGSYQGTSQLDPSNPATFTLLDNLIKELAEIFPDKYLHFGGDEVQIPCYASSAKVKAYMKTMGWETSSDGVGYVKRAILVCISIMLYPVYPVYPLCTPLLPYIHLCTPIIHVYPKPYIHPTRL